MVSFRDQQEDGAWNLIERQTSGDATTHSREYVFIHLIEYAETQDSLIALDGGVAEGKNVFLLATSHSRINF